MKTKFTLSNDVHHSQGSHYRVVVVRIRVFLEKKVHSEKINWTRAQTKNSEFPHRDNSSKI